MFKDYASLSGEQRQKIIETFRLYKELGYTDPDHATACAAASALELTDRQWNGKAGANAFAAALATLVMSKDIHISF